jgi:hypothetical protein
MDAAGVLEKTYKIPEKQEESAGRGLARREKLCYPKVYPKSIA